MNPYVDLHLHTCFSDGSDTPAVVAERAAALGVAAIAVTDHDTVAGVEHTAQAAKRLGLGFLTGVEISSRFDGKELHVVALGIRLDHEPLLEALDELRRERLARTERIVERLRSRGVPVDLERVRARSAGGIVGRLHIAQEVQAMGVTATVQQVFDKYIGAGRRAYVPKTALPCEKALDLIHGAGGLAFVGHPGVGSTTQRLLPRVLTLPFDGIEVFHCRHTPGQVDAFMSEATERGLLVSGGSDCHGGAKAGSGDTHGDESAKLGTVRIPYTYFERIQEALASRESG